MPDLAFYLRKIRQNESINYHQFALQCQKQSLPGWQKVFQFKQLHKQHYAVGILDQAQFEAWCARYLGAEKTRIGAAQIGNSHQYRVSANYLLRRTPQQAEPDLVWLAQNAPTPANCAPNAVVLENLENFVHWQAMQTLLRQWLPANDEQAFDWLFGAGNQISNPLNADYLAQYQQIYCLFDWDLGGLQIFRNLRLLLPQSHLQFLLPTEPLVFLRKSLRPLNMAHRAKLFALQHLSAETDRLIGALLASEKCLEQELYLIGMGG